MDHLRTRRPAFFAVVLTVLFGCLGLAAHADDRDLLRTGTTNPYVFIILDTSGSMNWTTPCSAADYTAGKCRQVCTPKDCTAPLNGDDPASKFYQAREALYEVIGATQTPDVHIPDASLPLCSPADYAAGACTEVNPCTPAEYAADHCGRVAPFAGTSKINFGFATYNSDRPVVNDKHFLFQCTNCVDWYLNGQPFVVPNEQQVIGTAITCNGGSAKGCTNGKVANAASLTDAWETQRYKRFPKGGLGWTATTQIWVQATLSSNTRRYRVTYDLEKLATPGTNPTVTNTPGDQIQIKITVDQCNNDDCTSFVAPVNSCLNAGACSMGPPVVGSPAGATRTYTYTLLSDFVAWENGVSAGSTSNGNGYFNSSNQDGAAANTCSGWEANTDTGTSGAGSSNVDYCTGSNGGCSSPNQYLFKYPTQADVAAKWPLDTSPTTGPFSVLNRGDMIPLDWRNDNRAAIRARLSPNLYATELPVLGASPDPTDFRIATYLKNIRVGTYLPFVNYTGTGQLKLPYKSNTGAQLYDIDSGARTLFPSGSTPIGASMTNFRTWFSSWKPVANLQDPDFGCRRVYLLFLTDGDETCNGTPCTVATNLKNDGVKTYIVGFGLANSPTLTCIATNGGTGAPILPQNKQELVEKLTGIFSEIQEDARAFASAAVPSTQAQVVDKSFLTTFRPLNNESVWPGQVDSYINPIPVTADGRPDENRACNGGSIVSECHSWDAAEEMVGGRAFFEPTYGTTPATPASPPRQAALASEIALGNYRLGAGTGDRRVYYSQVPAGGVLPYTRQFLLPKTLGADQLDQWVGFGLVAPSATCTGACATTAQAKSKDIIDFTLAIKDGDYQVPCQTSCTVGSTTCIVCPACKASCAPTDLDCTVCPEKPTKVTKKLNYILGDIFHSDPNLVGSPTNFRYFANNLYNNGKACSDTSTPNPGYKCFAGRHAFRRKLLLLGSNDGAVHAFDAGKFKGTVLNEGTPTNPKNVRVTGSYDDGTGKELFAFVPRLAMPKLAGYKQTAAQDWSVDGTIVSDDVFVDPILTAGVVAPAQREWRTVAIGGMREGGFGYYALDITQPDTLTVYKQTLPAAADIAYLPPYSDVDSYVPNCSCVPAGSCPGGAGDVVGCRSLPGTEQIAFPMERWELTDDYNEDASGLPNTQPDMGHTWSVPNIGRIRVVQGGTRVDKFVAVFGGGMDPEKADKRGNWLYMADIETGKIIYKRQLIGSAPSEPAAVDTDFDGYLDTIYIGTTAGLLYKVRLVNPSDGSPPTLSNITINDYTLGTNVITPRAVTRLSEAWLDPFAVFDAARPIYYPPAVVYIGELQHYGLAFGTGDREDLWSDSTVTGRFFFIVDTGFLAGGTLYDEDDYTQVGTLDANITTNLLLNPGGKRPGWFMVLNPNERIISKSLSISGLLTFTAFEPAIDDNAPGGSAAGTVCARTGTSRIFIVSATNANAINCPATGTCGLGDLAVDEDKHDRYWSVSDFVTNPYIKSGQTKNPPNSGGAGGSGGGGGDEDLHNQALDRLRDEMIKQYPPQCSFGAFTVEMEVLRADTGVYTIARIPICLIDKNWKEYVP